MHWNFNTSMKGQLHYLLSHSCPSLPFLTMTSCSLQAGVTLCGHHCPVGPAGFPSAGLSAVLSDQSEEEGQEGCCPGEDCPESWQRGWGRGLQTGWRDKYTIDNVMMIICILIEWMTIVLCVCVNLHRWSKTLPNSVRSLSIPRQTTQRNLRALRWTLK